MGLIILVYFILTTTVMNILTETYTETIPQQNIPNRSTRSILEKMFYPKTNIQSTITHHSAGLHNSFGVSGNVGIGLHFGGGYRIKNGDGKNDQEIVHNKIYDKYLGTSFGFGSLGSVKNGIDKNVEQSISEDQQTIYNDEGNLADQESENETIQPTTTTTTTTTEKPKSGVFRKIGDYFTGEHSEPKSDYTSNGIFKWSMQKFKNKKNIGTPR